MRAVSISFVLMCVIEMNLRIKTHGQFTFSPEDISACVGDEIQLNWQYMGTPIIKHCHKDGKVDVITIISSPVIHSTYDGRLIYNGRGNITIINVATTDSGTYVFEILYDLNRLFTDAVNVKVYDSIRNPPNIQYDKKMNKLSCSVDGNTEEMSFIWKLNGEDVSTNPEISPNESGLYICNVSSLQIQHCLRDEVNATAVLYLAIGVPKIQVRFPLVKIRIQMSATLECYVEESTPLVNKWKWYKKDNEERILSDAATIHIPYVTADDNGEYVCIASNAIGDSDPETIQLQILHNGNITDQKDPLNTSGGNDTILVVSLVLSCLVVIFIICATLGWFLYRKRCQTINNELEDNYFGGDNVSTITESTLSSNTTYIHYQQIRDGITGGDTGSSSYASVDSVRPVNGDNSDVVTITSNISSEVKMEYFDDKTRSKKKAASLLLLMNLREHDEELLQAQHLLLQDEVIGEKDVKDDDVGLEEVQVPNTNDDDLAEMSDALLSPKDSRQTERTTEWC